jgi:hypothetical protein
MTTAVRQIVSFVVLEQDIGWPLKRMHVITLVAVYPTQRAYLPAATVERDNLNVPAI